jgi:hypothetical protein
MKESRITTYFTYLRLTQKQSNIFLIKKTKKYIFRIFRYFDVFNNVYKQIKENEVKRKSKMVKNKGGNWELSPSPVHIPTTPTRNL